MENTGNFKSDGFLLGISWIGSIAAWQVLPIILSSIASALVIYNQYQIAKKKTTKSKK